MRFPKLPHLEHLGLEYSGCLPSCKCLLNLEEMNLNEETLPSLKSIELPVGFKFTEDDVRTIEFPRLMKLILRVCDTQEDMHGSVEDLRKLFPNPSKLTLVNVGTESSVIVYYLWVLITHTSWFENIQEVQIIGFNLFYLGAFLGRLKFRSQVALEKFAGYGGVLNESLEIEFENILKRMGLEFEESVAGGQLSTGSIILTKGNQPDSHNDKT